MQLTSAEECTAGAQAREKYYIITLTFGTKRRFYYVLWNCVKIHTVMMSELVLSERSLLLPGCFSVVVHLIYAFKKVLFLIIWEFQIMKDMYGVEMFIFKTKSSSTFSSVTSPGLIFVRRLFSRINNCFPIPNILNLYHWMDTVANKHQWALPFIEIKSRILRGHSWT